MRKALSLLLGLSTFTILTIAGEHKVPPRPQQVFAPYWTAEPGWHTEFQLRNNMIAAPLTVTPVLRLANGEEYALTPVTIPPSDVVTVDVPQELEKIAPALTEQAGTYGSVVFRFTSPFHHNLYSAVMVHEVGEPIGYHIDTSPVDPAYSAGSHEGIWWLPRPGVKDNLIIANHSDKPNQGRLLLYDASGRAWQQDVPLAPRQTVRFVVGDLVKAAGLSGNYGGLRFETSQGTGYIDTFYFLYDETSGFSATMKMFDHNPASTLQERLFPGRAIWTTWAPMLALQNPDPALALPAGTQLQPKVFLRNTTAKLQTVNVKLTWRGEAQSGVLALPPMKLRASQTSLIDVATLQQNKKIPEDARWALVEISSPTAKPDDLMAVASSYDSTGRFGAQTPFSDQLADHWAGGEWVVDANHNSIIAVTNVGKKPAEALLIFHYNGGQSNYEVQKTIAPGDQLWLNMGDLIRNAVPDRNGKTLPADLTFGTYDIRQLNAAGSPSLFEGKIIVDKTYGHLAYGCTECCGHSMPSIEADPEDLGVLGQDTLGVWAENNCSLQYDDMTASFSGWDTNNHSIATMNSTQITGVGAGSANAFASGNYIFGTDGSKKCPNRNYVPRNATNIVPTFDVAYSAYIPVDHISGPTACGIYNYPLIYMGDANRYTYRTTESIFMIPDLQQSSGFFPDTGQTRNYGPPSPVNGSTLSQADEDGVPNDCYLWNASGKASSSGFAHDESYPYNHQGQSHFSGSACNPLESPCATIDWDVRTVIDTGNPQSPTAYVNYNHTCYPRIR